jgi:hypothetical protein
MTASLPGNDPGNDTDGTPTAALDEDAAPDTGTEPDTAGPADATAATDVEGVPNTGPDAAARTVLDGPALENDEMRRGTEDLTSSEDKIAEAREFAQDVSRHQEPEPPARPGDES